MNRSLLPPISAGLVTAFAGFASTFAVILKGLAAAGATDAQAASGLMAVTIAMGLAGIGLSLWFRMPISAAWSTPGAALLAATATPAGGFAASVGAFLVCGALIVAAGLIKPFGRAVNSIPGSLASAMLAGVLFGLVLAPVKAMVEAPYSAALVIVAWLLVSRWKRLLATPTAAIVAALIIVFRSPAGDIALSQIVPPPLFVTPVLEWQAIVSIALPLFIVTMASQNLPGLAVLKAFKYEPEPGPLIATTGVFSLLAAPFGSHAVNLSAITAALCASPDASPDPGRRWIASLTAGIVYVVLGLTAGAITHIATGSPILIEAVAGLALLAPFGSSLHNALADINEREAALVTFLVSCSGVAFFGIGGAFWGLLAGGAVLWLTRAGASATRAAAPPR